MAAVDLDAVARTLYPSGLPEPWRAVQCLENHDIVYRDHAGSARIVALADPGAARSWYARSRARVANALLLTAPGIPMLFMGQEFLEDKVWSDDPRDHPDTLIWWDGLESGQKAMADHLRFMQDLLRLRRTHPALRGNRINVFHVHGANRVIAFQRWLEGAGRDVVVVASLNESSWPAYDLGFPRSGAWIEAFNSDVYDDWVNPRTVGNHGGIDASGAPLHGLPASASIAIPPNGVVVFTLDRGDT
jgi:1,4-alpha-glucan branching enzyme